MKNSSKYYMNILHELDTFDYNVLSDDNKLTYDILKTHAANEIDFADLCINYQPFSPTIGIQAQLPILMSQYALGSEKDVPASLSSHLSPAFYLSPQIEEPANYLKYYVGYLEFMHLKESMKKKRGDSYSDIEFHRFVLENGPAPFSILEKYLDLK
ncbi:MAG: DUF885 domain-containing protein [Lachnospiraceae bacterium]|nr:DUF885 domain-containing protein [Lachnospiraceae bacterium]